MTDNNTPNTTQQANTPPEGNGTAGKMFTQEEVNSIVKDRLARERAKGQTSGATDNSAAELDTEKAQLEADRQKLQDERNAFECERYCKENGIDPKLVELIGNSDPEEFKEKTESLWSIFAKSQKNQPGAVAVVSYRCTAWQHVAAQRTRWSTVFQALRNLLRGFRIWQSILLKSISSRWTSFSKTNRSAAL